MQIVSKNETSFSDIHNTYVVVSADSPNYSFGVVWRYNTTKLKVLIPPYHNMHMVINGKSIFSSMFDLKDNIFKTDNLLLYKLYKGELKKMYDNGFSRTLD